MIDRFAAEIGMDAVEIRRKNLVQPSQFPFTTARGTKYDCGNYPGALDKALEAAGYEDLRAEQKRRQQSGDKKLLGIGVSVVAGWLVYRKSVHLNLAKFFRYTGIALIVIAAGVLAYGLHDLQEAGTLPGLNTLAFDVSKQISPSSWYGTLLKGTLNFSPQTTWLQLVAYLGYLVPTMWLFLRPASINAVRPTRPLVAVG